MPAGKYSYILIFLGLWAASSDQLLGVSGRVKKAAVWNDFWIYGMRRSFFIGRCKYRFKSVRVVTSDLSRNIYPTY